MNYLVIFLLGLIAIMSFFALPTIVSDWRKEAKKKAKPEV
jgi:hypothetical protein